MNRKGKGLFRSGIALSLTAVTSLHATNGDHLIGLGAKARGMGGAGIALSHGAESGLQNPALLTKVEGHQISFGGTLFMPDVTLNGEKSDADINMIPEVSLARKINENWYIGIGMWGTAGMGVDYRDAPLSSRTFQMNTALQLMQFGVPVAYKTGDLSLAVAPILQYGALDINYNMTSIPGVGKVGEGLAQDLKFGFSAGLTYDITENFTVGAMYKSPIKMHYNKQMTTATAPFMLTGISDDLEQPEEYGVGVAFSMDGHSIAVDYKRINWSKAEGYKQFNWQDQDVYAVGYQYERNNWALRLGYNHGDSPIVNSADTRLNMMNLMGFPAIVEDHYTVGGSYAFSETFTLDLALTYADETSETMSGVFGENTVVHSQLGGTFQLTYNF
jgi:long-chain fatty acid transport protein